MTGVRLRWLGAAVAVAALSAAMATAAPSGMLTLMKEVGLRADNGFIMGGTGMPDPSSAYIAEVEQLYLNNQVPGIGFTGLNTPEEFCPFVCFAAPSDDPSSWSSLDFAQSVNTGVAVLNEQIQDALAVNASAALGVLGYSQSATVATVEMNNLIAAGQTDPNLQVVLLGDPNSPIGGILDRFQFPDGVGAFSLSPEPQHLLFVDIPLSLASTPTDTFPTDIYTGEYDGYADFPEDPSNIFADINALIGIETVHPYYPDPTAGVNLDINNVIDLGKIGDTNFYEIPAPLPTLAFLYDGGPAGQFFYDASSPFATLQDDWAYGNPGDPGAGITVGGVAPIGAAGPWQVDATGQLVASGVDGFLLKMDPLQMLAGMEYAAAQSIIGPVDDILQDAGQSPLPTSVVNGLMSGYDYTNQLDASLLTEWTNLTANMPSLAPDAIFDGAPAISGQPLIDLAGYGFDIFNYFGG